MVYIEPTSIKPTNIYIHYCVGTFKSGLSVNQAGMPSFTIVELIIYKQD